MAKLPRHLGSPAIDGSSFPWDSDTLFFSTYRLYPSSTILDLRAAGVVSIDSIAACASSFASPSVNVDGSFANGTPSRVVVSSGSGDSLLPTFALNTGPELCSLTGHSGDTVWDVSSGPGGSLAPQHAFGSGAFLNPDHLTTALGVDDSAFV